MKLCKIIQQIEKKIPRNLAILDDFIGLMDKYDLDQEISNVYIIMDLYPTDIAKFEPSDLIITHHKPLFTPKIATYVLHSNWDVIKGGANDALAEKLNLEVIDILDKDLGIGRICKPKENSLNQFLKNITDKFPGAEIVGYPKKFKQIGVISGFGLKNPHYVDLAQTKGADILISGDLTHEVAIKAQNQNICLINIGHHLSEVPGLYQLQKKLLDAGIKSKVVDGGAPMQTLKIYKP